jgi:hypothetical protein
VTPVSWVAALTSLTHVRTTEETKPSTVFYPQTSLSFCTSLIGRGHIDLEKIVYDHSEFHNVLRGSCFLGYFQRLLQDGKAAAIFCSWNTIIFVLSSPRWYPVVRPANFREFSQFSCTLVFLVLALPIYKSHFWQWSLVWCSGSL